MATVQIFDEQNYLRIKTTITTLAAADVKSAVIEFKTPGEDGVWGEWAATHDPETNIIYYDLPLGTTLKSIATALEVESVGLWTFRGVATMDDDRPIQGTFHYEMIFETNP